MTMRNDMSPDGAADARLWLLPAGHGVGGAGVHWNGQTWRFWDSDFSIKTHLTQRYGAAKIKNLQLQDWGVTWNEIEHSFDKFEYLCGISGKAGNLKGQIQPGGNPFESPRAREYPNPPLKMPYSSTLFAEAATELGYHPFPLPSSNLSQAYVNPLGVRDGRMHLLRLLRALRLRQLFQGQRPDHHPAGADEEAEFRGCAPNARC